jgi:hypothetical protein
LRAAQEVPTQMGGGAHDSRRFRWEVGGLTLTM